MPHLPEALMSCDQAFDGVSVSNVCGRRRASHHEIQDIEQALRHMDIPVIAGVMERDEDLVGQASRIARLRRRGSRTAWVISHSLSPALIVLCSEYDQGGPWITWHQI